MIGDCFTPSPAFAQLAVAVGLPVAQQGHHDGQAHAHDEPVAEESSW
jgi:hypothetical protein